MTGIERIAAERRRQIEEGWTPGHDAQHINGELSTAAAYYSYPCQDPSFLYPGSWSREWMKRKGFPIPTDRDLIKAGALLQAEIERELRAKDGEVKP